MSLRLKRYARARRRNRQITVTHAFVPMLGSMLRMEHDIHTDLRFWCTTLSLVQPPLVRGELGSFTKLANQRIAAVNAALAESEALDVAVSQSPSVVRPLLCKQSSMPSLGRLTTAPLIDRQVSLPAPHTVKLLAPATTAASLSDFPGVLSQPASCVPASVRATRRNSAPDMTLAQAVTVTGTAHPPGRASGKRAAQAKLRQLLQVTECNCLTPGVLS